MKTDLSTNQSHAKHLHGLGSLGGALLKQVAAVGQVAWHHWRALHYVSAVIGTVLWLGINPRFWKKQIRHTVALQVMAVGIEPLGFICALGAIVGISIVVQLTFWTGEAGQSRLLGPLLVAVVARELGPVLINLVVIVRSGSAMTTELGVLKIGGEVRALEANGGDPFLHLVMPRVIGVAVSTFCLTIVFILVAFASGYMFAAWMGKGSRDLLLFADTLSNAVHPKDVFNVLAKTALPALFASATCCIGGLNVKDSFKEIPQATQRALTRSIAGLFVISASVSLLTYLKA
ncbi:MAG TPA: ABC transporter permease [Candidatus Saccharimonadales bacterium]|nr:ABC transporter permease [Candidatus Saccharimonadales bacterium]